MFDSGERVEIQVLLSSRREVFRAIAQKLGAVARNTVRCYLRD